MASGLSQQILDYLLAYPSSSSGQIYSALNAHASYATIKRALTKSMEQGFIISSGQGRGRTYQLSPSYGVLRPLDIEEYFKKEIDERPIRSQFNVELIRTVLPHIALFSVSEHGQLESLHQRFVNKVADLNPVLKAKEMQRLAIDLSWKSSQIEGNTYTLLETELLLNEQQTAAGKPKDDATMLLNHKEAIGFITAHPDYLVPLSIRTIEDIHSILIKDLGVDRNIRNRGVGITGTNYRPPENEHLVRQAMLDMCNLINTRPGVFEKALLALLLIAYIQPFNDGNKRTSRIVSNALLLSAGYCPLSYRTVTISDYKKSILLFYEQNNISAFKQLFIDQYEFAVNTYF